jgi:thioredoxin-related protein
VKRILFSFTLVSAMALVGCNGDDMGVDLSKATTDTNAPPVNLIAEISKAKSENKLLLIEFGSSDACPPCVLFQQKVFSTPEFIAYAQSNLDFVRLDFPLKSNLRPDTSATNVLLSQQYEAFGFPTFIAIGRDGKEFWRMPAKNDADPGIDTKLFEPTNFINLLAGLRQKEQ